MKTHRTIRTALGEYHNLRIEPCLPLHSERPGNVDIGRILNWLTPDEMRSMIASLSAAAPETFEYRLLQISQLRQWRAHGKPGWSVREQAAP